MARQYSAGIIGTGGICESHFEGLKNTGRAEIVCAYDENVESLKAAQARWGARPMASAEALIRSDVDIVVIATPGFAHREYVEAAAAAGKHTICEKPVALKLDDAVAMQAAVDKAGITFQVSFNHRNDPAFVTLKRFQDGGRLKGTVSAWARLYAPIDSARWRRIQQTGHWRASMDLSGGRINEFCSHTVNWLLWVLGAPKTVYGRALHVTEGFELDDADYALLVCENGTGLLDVSRHAGVPADAHFGIMGHGGSIVLKDGRVTFTPMDEETEPVPIAGDVPSKHAEFLDCIEAGTQPRAGMESAIETLRLCLAFNRSAQSGRVEKV
ncbi:MAG: Gfo/Idh/MocA family oxidoreductase [Kiritimatiellae bacterium]|nr:Gfo/Idh/MocA family oxidoreductase [Kiritimatiellia bacterium]